MCSQNFVLIGKSFDQETLFLQGMTWKKSHLWLDIFWCLTLQKRVFRSLSFPTWTKFGEQIAIILHYCRFGSQYKSKVWDSGCIWSCIFLFIWSNGYLWIWRISQVQSMESWSTWTRRTGCSTKWIYCILRIWIFYYRSNRKW